MGLRVGVAAEAIPRPLSSAGGQHTHTHTQPCMPCAVFPYLANRLHAVEPAEPTAGILALLLLASLLHHLLGADAAVSSCITLTVNRQRLSLQSHHSTPSLPIRTLPLPPSPTPALSAAIPHHSPNSSSARVGALRLPIAPDTITPS